MLALLADAAKEAAESANENTKAGLYLVIANGILTIGLAVYITIKERRRKDREVTRADDQQEYVQTAEERAAHIAINVAERKRQEASHRRAEGIYERLYNNVLEKVGQERAERHAAEERCDKRVDELGKKLADCQRDNAVLGERQRIMLAQLDHMRELLRRHDIDPGSKLYEALRDEPDEPDRSRESGG